MYPCQRENSMHFIPAYHGIESCVKIVPNMAPVLPVQVQQRQLQDQSYCSNNSMRFVPIYEAASGTSLPRREAASCDGFTTTLHPIPPSQRRLLQPTNLADEGPAPDLGKFAVPQSTRITTSSSIRSVPAARLYCTFCRRNGEPREQVRSHSLRTWDPISSSKKISCPVLRMYKCPGCGATGDNAHTLTYCPEARREVGRRPESIISKIEQTLHLSSGRRRPQLALPLRDRRPE